TRMSRLRKRPFSTTMLVTACCSMSTITRWTSPTSEPSRVRTRAPISMYIACLRLRASPQCWLHEAGQPEPVSARTATSLERRGRSALDGLQPSSSGQGTGARYDSAGAPGASYLTASGARGIVPAKAYLLLLNRCRRWSGAFREFGKEDHRADSRSWPRGAEGSQSAALV